MWFMLLSIMQVSMMIDFQNVNDLGDMKFWNVLNIEFDRLLNDVFIVNVSSFMLWVLMFIVFVVILFLWIVVYVWLICECCRCVYIQIISSEQSMNRQQYMYIDGSWKLNSVCVCDRLKLLMCIGLMFVIFFGLLVMFIGWLRLFMKIWMILLKLSVMIVRQLLCRCSVGVLSRILKVVVSVIVIGMISRNGMCRLFGVSVVIYLNCEVRCGEFSSVVVQVFIVQNVMQFRLSRLVKLIIMFRFSVSIMYSIVKLSMWIQQLLLVELIMIGVVIMRMVVRRLMMMVLVVLCFLISDVDDLIG